ncbi:hypothetical protein HDV00_008325 [Rhizophlyctis rosea]|nr:hypothetical protein HDV00_008325 [Rhizophlyctis rosea]
MAVAKGLKATLEALPKAEEDLRLAAVVAAAKDGKLEAVEVLVAFIRRIEPPPSKTAAVLREALDEAAGGGYDAIVAVLREEVGCWMSDWACADVTGQVRMDLGLGSLFNFV